MQKFRQTRSSTLSCGFIFSGGIEGNRLFEIGFSLIQASQDFFSPVAIGIVFLEFSMDSDYAIMETLYS